MASTADYDAPRRPVIDLEDTATEGLAVGRSVSQSPTFDLDDAEVNLDATGPETLDEELTATVVPMLDDEFRCSQCFLVHHRSQLALQRDGQDICSECA